MEWRKPALVVLVRRKSEEGVLETCKNASTPAGPVPVCWGSGEGRCYDMPLS